MAATTGPGSDPDSLSAAETPWHTLVIWARSTTPAAPFQAGLPARRRLSA